MLYKGKQAPGLQKINRATRPGLCNIYFLPVERCAGDPVLNSAGMISVFPALTSKFSIARMQNFSKDYAENWKEDDGGGFYDIAVTGMLAFESKGNNNALRAMKYHRYILLVETPGNIIKWLGTKENPVKFVQSMDSGRKSGSTSPGSTLTFQWSSENKPFELGIDIPGGLIYTG